MPGSKVELEVALQRRDRELRTARRLHDRQVDLGEDVVAVALEARVARDVHLDVRVAGDAAAGARVTLAADADPLAVVDPGRNLDLELLHLDRAPVPFAGGAGRLDDGAGAEARRARLGADELAEDAAARPAAAGPGRRRSGR